MVWSCICADRRHWCHSWSHKSLKWPGQTALLLSFMCPPQTFIIKQSFTIANCCTQWQQIEILSKLLCLRHRLSFGFSLAGWKCTFIAGGAASVCSWAPRSEVCSTKSLVRGPQSVVRSPESAINCETNLHKDDEPLRCSFATWSRRGGRWGENRKLGPTDCWRFATESLLLLLQQLLAFVELTIWPGPLFAAIYVGP